MMPRRRVIRVVTRSILLALFIVLAMFAARYLVATVSEQGWRPAAVFGLLLLIGAIGIVWRSALDLRAAIRKMRK